MHALASPLALSFAVPHPASPPPTAAAAGLCAVLAVLSACWLRAQVPAAACGRASSSTYCASLQRFEAVNSLRPCSEAAEAAKCFLPFRLVAVAVMLPACVAAALLLKPRLLRFLASTSSLPPPVRVNILFSVCFSFHAQLSSLPPDPPCCRLPSPLLSSLNRLFRCAAATSGICPTFWRTFVLRLGFVLRFVLRFGGLCPTSVGLLEEVFSRASCAQSL